MSRARRRVRAEELPPEPAPRWRAPGSYDVDPRELVPWTANPREITEASVEKLASAIRELGWGRPVLVRASDATIIAGHRSVRAALRLGLATVPVRAIDVDDEGLAKLALADNGHGEDGMWDPGGLEAVLAELGDVDLELLGISEALLELSESEAPAPPDPGPAEGAGRYTAKIVSPVYTPKAPTPPPVAELVDRTRVEQLREEIVAAGLPEEVRGFLLAAAERHARFSYSAIAEYYAHAPAEVQRLMEASGLVIVDFNRAIELGFVRLTERLAELAGLEVPDPTETDVPGGSRAS